jgi:glutamine synthetase
MDLMQPVFDALGDAFETLGLGLRSIENEWGPGQVECTFAPRAALEAADNVLLFRTATRQICRRLGYFATFMCRPALKGFYPSGWHLHQSLTDAFKRRQSVHAAKSGEILSPLGRSYLAGLLQYAAPARSSRHRRSTAIAAFRPNSLAPDRATWAYDHRGAMIRVLGGPGDDPQRGWKTASASPPPIPISIFCRKSLPAFAGIDAQSAPPPPNDEPYAAERPMLPKSLPEALDALDQEPLFRRAHRRYLHRLLRQAEANRSRQIFAIARTSRRIAAKRRAECVGAERVFRFLLSIPAHPVPLEQGVRHDGAGENRTAADAARRHGAL